MHITNLNRATKTKMAMEGAFNVFKQIPISRQDGTPSFSFRVFTIEPGGHTPFHNHDFEHVNYVIEGNGTLVALDKEYEIARGDFVLVLPGEPHQYRNSSSSASLVIICAVAKDHE